MVRLRTGAKLALGASSGLARGVWDLSFGLGMYGLGAAEGGAGKRRKKSAGKFFGSVAFGPAAAEGFSFCPIRPCALCPPRERLDTGFNSALESRGCVFIGSVFLGSGAGALKNKSGQTRQERFLSRAGGSFFSAKILAQIRLTRAFRGLSIVALRARF